MNFCMDTDFDTYNGYAKIRSIPDRPRCILRSFPTPSCTCTIQGTTRTGTEGTRVRERISRLIFSWTPILTHRMDVQSFVAFRIGLGAFCVLARHRRARARFKARHGRERRPRELGKEFPDEFLHGHPF